MHYSPISTFALKILQLVHLPYLPHLPQLQNLPRLPELPLLPNLRRLPHLSLLPHLPYLPHESTPLPWHLLETTFLSIFFLSDLPIYPFYSLIIINLTFFTLFFNGVCCLLKLASFSPRTLGHVHFGIPLKNS